MGTAKFTHPLNIRYHDLECCCGLLVINRFRGSG